MIQSKKSKEISAVVALQNIVLNIAMEMLNNTTDQELLTTIGRWLDQGTSSKDTKLILSARRELIDLAKKHNIKLNTKP